MSFANFPAQHGSAPLPNAGYPAAGHQFERPLPSRGRSDSSQMSAPVPMPPPDMRPPPQGPPPAIQQAEPISNVPTDGAFEGVQFRIDHRDTNTVLYMRLQPGYEIKAKPGAMAAMDPSVQIQGKLSVGFKKFFTGGQMAQSHFTGPGEVLLAPEVWGDIVPIHLDGRTQWHFGKHAYLAATRDITLNTKAQSLGKTLFSGHGLFVATATGAGMLFVQALGSIIVRTLANGEQWVVDNDHLVAWTANYNVERIQAGGLLSSVKTDEGLVCRFTGPGTVYIQSRSPEALCNWIAARIPES